MFHAGPARHGRLAGGAGSGYRRHAVDGSVLDSPIRHFVGTGHTGVPGESGRHEEPAGTKNGYSGMPVAAENARLWAAEELFSPGRRDPGDAGLLAAARTAYQRCVAVHSAYAEGAHANERATGQRDQRYQRADWPGDYQRDIAWGTGPQKAGATARSAHQGQRRGGGQKSGGQLASGSSVHTQTGTGQLRDVPKEDRGVRPAVGPALSDAGVESGPEPPGPGATQ